MTSIEKAEALLAEGYIQLNLASAPVKTTVNTIRAYKDDDTVFLQTVYNFASAEEHVGFAIVCSERDRKI